MVPRNALASLLILALVAVSSPASAQTALVDYVGYGWETGGLVPSDPGDELTVLTVTSSIDPVFGADPTSEVTIVITGLVSTGGFESGGVTTIAYTGGTLSMYEDPSNDFDWGINPPNGTAPTSFQNGDLLFEGAFTNFTLFLTADGTGAYEGDLDATGGSALATVCSNCAYSFAGVFTSETGAQVLEGYDVQVDGTLEVDSTIDGDASSFGAIKGLYGN
jgi:hypothetical protein